MSYNLYKENINLSFDFLIISFFTKNLEEKAKRLIASLDFLKLNYKIYKIPEIHTTSNLKGSVNSEYSLPKFILNVIEKYNMPILFVDADMVFHQYPVEIINFKKKIDFAAYNWFFDRNNAGYFPLPIKNLEQFQYLKERFYIYSHSVDYLSSSQLFSSSPVLFFSNSLNSKELLLDWLNNIKVYNNCVIDKLLDYTFNITFKFKQKLNTYWLDKSYCRFKFFIFSNPIINHPDELTNRVDTSHGQSDVGGNLRWDLKELVPRESIKFPKEYFIDVKNKAFFKLVDRKLTFIEKFSEELFL